MRVNGTALVRLVAVVAVGAVLGGVAAITISSSRPTASGGAEPNIPAATIAADSAAAAACEASEAASAYGVTSLYRAESTTAGEVAAWQEQRYAEDQSVSDLRGVEASAPVLVCIFRGSFVTPVGPPDPGGEPRPPHDLIRYLVMENGEIDLDAAGHEGTGNLAPETPSDWRKAEESSP